ncbi:hypothetical protein Tco_0439501 [Tanacetum coccineum]
MQTRSRTKEADCPNLEYRSEYKRKRPASQVDKPGSTQPVIKPPASQVFEDEDTDEPGSTQLQIPEHLYMFIQQALETPDYLRSKLETVNLIIADYTQSYILSGSLPSDWK